MKKIKDLTPGEYYLDSYGCRFKVVSVQEIPFLGIPNTSPQVKVTFESYTGRIMFINYRADKIVEVLK